MRTKMAAACVQEGEDSIPETSGGTKYISLEDLQNQLQLSGSETLTVQVDNESGYIIKCGDPADDPGVVTAKGDSGVIAMVTDNPGFVTAKGDSGIIAMVTANDSSADCSEYKTMYITTECNNVYSDNQSNVSTVNTQDLVQEKTSQIESATTENAETLNGNSEETLNEVDDKSSVEIAVQANDYDIERRSGKVPARRRMIPFKFRDYKNPDLVNEEANDSDSDYNPDLNEEVPAKKKKLVARKSTTGKRGRPRKSENDVVILIQSSGVGNSTSHILEYESLNDSLQQTISSAIANYKAKNTDEEENKADDEIQDTKPQTPTTKSVTAIKKKDGKSFECDSCHKMFSSKGNLKTHEKIHEDEKPFKCDFSGCGKAFRSNESLRRHRLSHMGIKPFECVICKNKFASNVSLQEHLSRHSQAKPHQCHICQKHFRQVSCLRRHLFTHSSDLPFSCNICGRRFSQNVYLRSHMKVHTGERPFKCLECGKAFAHQSDLTRHKIVHTGRKPYACEVCNAKFSDPSSKRRHEKEHVGSKPYVCQLCFESFKRGGQLKTHLSRKHTNQKEEAQVIQKDGLLQFIYKDGNGQPVPVSMQGDNADQVKDKKIVKLIKDLNNKMVQHVQIQQDGDSTIENLAAIETVVMETEQQSIEGVENNISGMSGENTSHNIQVETNGVGEETVITIAEVQELQEVSGSEVPVEYLQIIEGVIPESSNQEVVILPYNQGEETQADQISCEVVQEVNKDIIENHDKMESVEETPTEGEPQEEPQSVDFVLNPDFNSQQYYNWLSSFTELCKVMPMPLDLSLFQKINQVHKTLSDVMATPSGVVAEKDNFKILMNISQELNGIINEHLLHVMQNLDAEK